MSCGNSNDSSLSTKHRDNRPAAWYTKGVPSVLSMTRRSILFLSAWSFLLLWHPGIARATTPAVFHPITTIANAGTARQPVIVGDFIYVATDEGLTILTNADGHAVIGQVDFTNGGIDVAISGRYAYITTPGFGITIVDVSRPSTPAVVNLISTTGSARGIEIVGTTAYVTRALAPELRIYDITVQPEMTLLGKVSLAAQAEGLTVAGSYAYVATTTAGLTIVDITNTATPSIVTTFPAAQSVNDVAFANDTVYVADQGLRIVDVHTPANPTLLGTYHAKNAYAVSVVGTPPSSTVKIDGTFVVLSVGPEGILLLQTKNPKRPTVLAAYDTPGAAYAIVSPYATMVIGDGVNGVIVFDFPRAVRTVTEPLAISNSTYLLINPSGPVVFFQPFPTTHATTGWRISRCESGTRCDVYLFALTDANTRPYLKLYTAKGKLLQTLSPYHTSERGLSAKIIHQMIDDRHFIVVAPKKGPGTAVVYEVRSTGLLERQRLSTGTREKTGRTLLAFLPVIQDQASRLVTAGPGGRTIFWTYDAAKKQFIKDTTNGLAALIQVSRRGKGSISLK